MRGLADGSEMPAREAPTVMLPSSTTAANRRKSVRSKCTAQVLDELPFCLWYRLSQGYENPTLRLFEPIDNSVGMSNPIIYLVVVAAAFLVAGLVKGVTGLALPTVGVGLLSLAMPPGHAAALIVVPALITNLWQMISGPGLWSLVRRLWPMQLGICLGTWASARLMAGSETAFASAALGVALMAYAAFGLMNARVPDVPASAEWWLGALVGGATGFISAATGVFVIPAVPYLQALGFERDEFMQALGLCFTVATVALASSLVSAGILNSSTGLYSLLALVPALAGMIAGQRLLRVMRPETFRRWFFSGLALLGAHLAIGIFW
jgi:uncharacterized membrane protein YfcA